MPKYCVRAVDRSGVRVVSTVETADKDAVKALLTERGWTLLSVKRSSAQGWREYRLRQVSKARGTITVRQLGELLKAGVPMVTALEEAQRLAPQGSLTVAWQQVLRAVTQGDSLTDAFTRVPGLFASRHTALLSLGQSQNNLASALLDISEELDWRSDVLRRWKQACVYPVFAIALLMCVFGFLLLFVIPGLQPILQASGHDLPWVTQQLLSLTDVVQNQNALKRYLLPALVFGVFGLCALFLCIAVLYAHTPLRKSLNNGCLSSRFYRFWVWPFSVAAHARCVHLMLKQNMPLSEAVRLAAPAAGMWGTGRVWQSIAEKVEEEGLFANAIQQTPVVPSLYCALIRVGESYGTLEASLAMSSRVFHNQALEKLQRVEGLIGPTLLVFVGFIMAALVVWVLLPVYEVIATQGGVL